ncbi:protein-export chaperone SecB [Lactobacillus bombicola]|uniref:protein-export chaperone SecB n=1 Tax=Lactobacillus bombicola TaxID=1505723 RepID=UPI000E57ACBC|nr:protein-export chaperone SecB [Lactobacillus bombicola]RHW48712.1 hypothetical protein DS833_07645 [Lactobacillus bombicola]
MDTDKNKSVFQFTNPELIRSVFIANENYHAEKGKEFKMNVEPNAEEPEDINDKERCARVTLSVNNFDLTSKSIDDVLDGKPYMVFITMGATFKWNKNDIKSKDEKNFLKVNAASLLLGYIRPLLAELTGMSKFNTQCIPFIDFSNMPKSNMDN